MQKTTAVSKTQLNRCTTENITHQLIQQAAIKNLPALLQSQLINSTQKEKATKWWQLYLNKSLVTRQSILGVNIHILTDHTAPLRLPALFFRINLCELEGNLELSSEKGTKQGAKVTQLN